MSDRNAYNPTVKIYTKTGDSGDTSLFDGTRVSKTHPRVVAYGDVDEVQACLGVVAGRGPADGSRRDVPRRCSAICSRSARGWPIPSHKIAKRVEKIVIDDDSIARLEAGSIASIPRSRRCGISSCRTAPPRARRCISRAPSAGAPSASVLSLGTGRRRAGRDRLSQSPVRPALHDGARRQSSRRCHRNTVVDSEPDCTS